MLLIEAIEARKLNLVQEIISSGVDVNKIEDECILTPLELAVDLGHVDIVRALLEAGASIDVENYSPLESAIAKGHKDVVALLIELYPYTKDRIKQYRKALKVATIYGDLEIVGILLEAGIDVNATVGDTGTALHEAAGRDEIEIANFLFLSGADINARNESEEADILKKWTPLMNALDGVYDLLATSEEMVDLLLDAGADINAKDTLGKTPLMLAAKINRARLFNRLIDLGADINAKDAEGCTPLIIAADYGNSAIVKILIEAGATIDATDNYGNSALTYAEKDNPVEIAKPFKEGRFKFERYFHGLEKQRMTRRMRIAKYLREAGAAEKRMK